MIENHLEVFGGATVMYQMCEDFGIGPEDLVAPTYHKIIPGILSFTIVPKKNNIHNGAELAKLSARELKQALKDNKKGATMKVRARN
jgi:hypothetical protein